MSLNKIFAHPAKKKIAHFFHHNPASIDTSRGISTWTGLNIKETARALEELVKKGILVAHRVTSTVGYAYTNNKKLAVRIKKYFQKNKT